MTCNLDGNPPIFQGLRLWNHAASFMAFSFMAGVTPPVAIFGRSLWCVRSHWVACH